MSTLRPFALVRVVKLSDGQNRDAWRVNTRVPSVGDVGTLVDVLRADGHADRFVVECCERGDGATTWLADFAEDELAV
ncbi:MAG: hypothetical protein GQE15_19130 [Archangiaceae bacterium]|nr:hypothetical protein [Archangiaceae bacterium]